MTGLADVAGAWTEPACLGLAVLSAIIPWFNVEILVLALPAVARSSLHLSGLVLLVTLGQMLGKCVVYWTSRSGRAVASPRISRALERWRGRFARRPWSPVALVLASSAIGVPPFYLVTIAAGALEVDFVRFAAAGTLGRLIRFGLLAFIPYLLMRASA